MDVRYEGKKKTKIPHLDILLQNPVLCASEIAQKD
jgi:hypothetical protein